MSKKMKKNTELSSTIKGKIMQIRKNHARFCIAYASLQNTARAVIDSVSHAIGEYNLQMLILQYESAILRRLPSKRRVQLLTLIQQMESVFTDVYPVISGCNSRTLIQQ